jgi:outer membrane protein OmpA-like peptidoglycan-associated protein
VQNLIKAMSLTLWAGVPSMALGLTLDLPAPVIGEESRSETPGSYALPLAPFADGAVPSRSVEGALDQRVFQLDSPDLTTLAVMQTLRDQILTAGYTILLDCDARVCGGFDFRFGTDVMPEPDMHVDMGDFRFLSAERDGDAISILVSRSAASAYVQVTRVSPLDTPPPAPVASVDLDAEVQRGGDDVLPLADSDLGRALDDRGFAVLDDLVFASGAATLTEGNYASLASVADWLRANPDGTVALVGHTDASGSLAANVALSERRAEAVAQVLVDSHGVDRTRISAEGVGFLSPLATNQTEEGRQKNRRVEVIVTSTR